MPPLEDLEGLAAVQMRLICTVRGEAAGTGSPGFSPSHRWRDEAMPVLSDEEIRMAALFEESG
jgi:hypothetical protein